MRKIMNLGNTAKGVCVWGEGSRGHVGETAQLGLIPGGGAHRACCWELMPPGDPSLQPLVRWRVGSQLRADYPPRPLGQTCNPQLGSKEAALELTALGGGGRQEGWGWVS